MVKVCNPLGPGVWLATERDANGDTLYSLADPGYREIGSFSRGQLRDVRLPPWAAAACLAASIRACERVIHRQRHRRGDV